MGYRNAERKSCDTKAHMWTFALSALPLDPKLSRVTEVTRMHLSTPLSITSLQYLVLVYTFISLSYSFTCRLLFHFSIRLFDFTWASVQMCSILSLTRVLFLNAVLHS